MILPAKKHLFAVLVLVSLALPLVHADSQNYWIPTYGQSWVHSTIYVNIPATPTDAHDMVVHALAIWNAAQLWFASQYFPNGAVYTLKESSTGTVHVFFTDQAGVDSVAHGEKGDVGWTEVQGQPDITGANVYLVTSKIWIYLVAHEFGHVLGLGHIAVASESAQTCIYTDLMCHFVYGQLPSTLDLYALHLLAGHSTSDTVTLPAKITYGQSNPTSNLMITLPASAHAFVDGYDEGPGSFQVSLTLGSHTISVPRLVTIDDSSRLSFKDWNDGWLFSVRSLDIWSDATLTATYVTQYKVTVTNSLSATREENWYDQGSSASLTTQQSPQPMNGILGVLGAKWVFDGWYANGQYLSSSSAVSISVSSPLSLEARWHADYTLPIAVIVAIAIAVGALTFFVLRTRSQIQRK